MNSSFGLKLKEILMNWGLSEQLAAPLKNTIVILGLIIITFLAYFITKKVLFNVIRSFVKRSKATWDDILLNRKILRRVSHLIPALIIFFFSRNALIEYPRVSTFIQTGSYIYIILIGMLILDSFLTALNEIYSTLPASKERPIKGYIQSIKIVIYFIGVIIIISVIIGKSPTKLLASLGAIAAILILVFKDTILGLVSGIQLTANQMVKIGDWISMPSRNADGTVLEITLNTVKVQNWDRTISTIPTYALISESFQNWKGMEESEGRRIARSVNIDLKSIKFCDHEMLEKFKKIKLIREYITKKQIEIEEYNKKLEVDNNDKVSRRNLTNIGVFRKYIEIYLENNPKIHGANSGYTLIVRHLQPTEKGLPIQVYCFSKDQAWAKYEIVQADLFDHILAVLPEFELRVFQNPTGEDFKQLTQS
ncbi:MAG: mechanosensitive ion channel protein MscS [Marinilabiliales bacterium]|nr:MAG: mechanosensitive ion channel protein MscS [Marinilabiliales bacterium]